MRLVTFLITQAGIPLPTADSEVPDNAPWPGAEVHFERIQGDHAPGVVRDRSSVTVKADAEGRGQVALLPGRYSITLPSGDVYRRTLEDSPDPIDLADWLAVGVEPSQPTYDTLVSFIENNPNLKGPKGDTGEQGPEGPQGPPGPDFDPTLAHTFLAPQTFGVEARFDDAAEFRDGSTVVGTIQGQTGGLRVAAESGQNLLVQGDEIESGNPTGGDAEWTHHGGLSVTGNISGKLEDAGGGVFNVRAFGLRCDGVTDETLAFQAVLDLASSVGGGTVVIPGGDLLVSPIQQVPVRTWPTCINVPSNVLIRCEGGARIVMAPTSFSRYSVLSLADVENVVLEYLTIVGDADGHLGDDGEQGHGLQFLGAQNVVVVAPHVTRCWGDGIYFGTTNHNPPYGRPNRDIKIISPTCSYNGRNGVSITNGIGIRVDGLTAEYNDRTFPMAGFDIEPNYDVDEIDDVVFTNPTIRGGDRGFMVAVQKSQGEGNIQVINPRVYDTITGCYIAASLDNYTVLVDRPEFYRIQERAINVTHWVSPSSVLIRDPKIVDANLTGGDEAIAVGNPNTRPGVVGNVNITGIDIDSPSSKQALMLQEISDSIATYGTPTNLVFSFRRARVSEAPIRISSVAMDLRVTAENDSELTYRRPDGEPDLHTISHSAGFYRTYVGPSDKRIWWDLPNSSRVQGQRFTFIAGRFGETHVRPISTERFHYLDMSDGQRLVSFDKGARLTVVSTGDGWEVESMVGSWEAV